MSDTPRLKAKLLVQALLRQADVRGRPGMMLRRGDPDAGAIVVVLRDRAGGLRLLAQSRDPDGTTVWRAAGQDGSSGQDEVDAYLERAARRDPDLWVVEFEGTDLSLPFDGVER